MIIFLYGSDSYRLKQAREEAVNRYKIKYPSGLNFFSFDVSDASALEGFEDAVKSMSFFGEHKLVAIRNVFIKKFQADAILGYINKHDLAMAKDVTLLVTEDNPDKDFQGKHKDLFKLLSSGNSIVKNIEPLQGSKLDEWIGQEFKARNCEADRTVISKLISITGNDTWRLVNEIDKLAGYKNSGKITGADVDYLVSRSIDMNIFNLIDAIAQKNKSNALKLLYREMKTGQDPYYILTMIVSQFRNILMIKDLQKEGYSENEIIKKSKLHPFVVKKSINNPINTQEATEVYSRLLLMDTGFKLGRIDLGDSLYKLVS